MVRETDHWPGSAPSHGRRRPPTGPGAALTLPADVAHTFTAEVPGTRLLGFATGDRAGRLFRDIVSAVAEHPDQEKLVPTLPSVARANDVEFV